MYHMLLRFVAATAEYGFGCAILAGDDVAVCAAASALAMCIVLPLLVFAHAVLMLEWMWKQLGFYGSALSVLLLC